MTDLEQKIILNSYDVFPVNFVDGKDLNSEKRNSYIQGGMDAVNFYDDSLDKVLLEIPDHTIDDAPWDELNTTDNSADSKGNKLF